MDPTPSHPKQDIIRYLEGSLPEPQQAELQDHLSTCPSCSDFLDFSRGFADAVTSLGEESTEEEDCPDSWTLTSYVEGDLDEQTERQVKAHLLYCDSCWETVRMLRELPPKRIVVDIKAAGGIMEPRQVSRGTVQKVLAASATKTRGKPVFVSPFRIAEKLNDPETGKPTSVTLRIEESLKEEQIRVVVESDPVPDKWRISLFDAEREELSSLPLARSQVEVSSYLPYGFYILEVQRGEDCLGEFSFTVEPFNLPEAIESGLEYLRTRHYSRALAVLEDATKRYPTSQEAWDVLCLAQATAMQDEEGFELDQQELGVVRSATDLEEDVKDVLEKRKERFGDDMSSLLAEAMAHQLVLTEAIVSRLKEEKPSLPVIQAIDILKVRTKTTNDMLTQLFVDVTSRFDQFSPLIESLQKSIDAISGEVSKNVDEKFAAVGEMLGRFTEEVPQKGLALPDYEPLFRRQLGDDCWVWLGDEVQKMFVSAEGVYRYFGSLPALHTPDFTPALLQFCRGLELLLNMKLRNYCEEIARAASRQQFADLAAATQLTPGIIAGAVRLDGSLSLTQIANLMLIGSVMQQKKTAALDNPLASLLTTSRLADFQFIALLTHVGLFFRNGKIHPRPDSPSNFTSPEEIQVLRKLIVGLDENHVASGKILDNLRETKWPWSSNTQREETLGRMAAEWRPYPGLLRMLWRATEAKSS